MDATISKKGLFAVTWQQESVEFMCRFKRFMMPGAMWRMDLLVMR